MKTVKTIRTLPLMLAMLVMCLPAIAAVDIPDDALRAKINIVLDKPISAEITQAEMESLTALELNNTTALEDLTGLETATNLQLLYLSKTGVTDLSPIGGLTSLETLYLNNTGVSDISAVSGLTALTDLSFNKTGVTDISAVSGLTNLTKLRLHGTAVSDISAVSGLTNLDVLYVQNTQVTDLTPGIHMILSDFRYANTPALALPWVFTLISGDAQQGDVNTALAAPFVVDILNQVGTAMADIDVSFTVTAGGGSLSASTATTDANGEAQTTLTLGTAAGQNTVTASVEGITDTITFTATAIAPIAPEPAPEPDPEPVPTTLVKISGDLQGGLEPNDVSAPLVVQVNDANDTPMQGITVSWTLETGEGPLSDTETTTGENGQTQITVTMGSRGRHTVVAAVENIETTQTFYSYAQKTPAKIEIYGGDNQILPVGTSNRYSLEPRVLDVDGNPVNGVRIEWEVRSGGGNLREHEGYGNYSITDGMGIASKLVRVGPEPGINTYAATVEGVEGEALFTLEGMTGKVPFRVLRSMGNNQEGYTGQQIPETFYAEVRDYYEKPIGLGVTVHWKVISGDATLAHKTSDTILSSGIAPNKVTLGSTPGTVTVQAYIPRVYSSAVFTFTSKARLTADVDFNGVVDVQDLLVVTNAFGETTDLGVKDINADGEITLADIRAVLDALEADAAGAPARESTASLQHWTQEAIRVNREANNLYARGVEVLQMLLEEMTVPEKTQLLRNYPNPFNPETWIPYQLAKATEVSISIYNTTGVLVRTLDLGHQAAGVYQHRSRAAYWDGKNAVGEPVASGVYFYTFTAGNFTATQKMVIRK